MSRQYEASPAAYRRVFEDSKEGAAILEDLIKRYSQMPKAEGIDRLINMAEQKGRREVLDFIVAMINRANGVDDVPSEESVSD